MDIYEKLLNIQQGLKAPKNQFNKFGGYYYRSCEDILEALKPLLKENKCVLTINDEIVGVNNRAYVKATVTLTDCEDIKSFITNTAYAREPEDKKGADDSQITGACSSYARKYSLNGLFCIDDVKDADATNAHAKDNNVVKKATATQLKKIDELINDKAGMFKYYGITKLEDLTLEQASEIIKKKGGKTNGTN